MNFREYVLSIFAIICITGIFSFIFYESIFAFVIFLLPSFFYIKKIREWLMKRRIHSLMLQFKDFCQSLSAQLAAGYSMENAFVEVYRELSQMYGINSIICYEVKIILLKIKLNITIENSLFDLSKRCKIEEIEIFAEVVANAKRTGGDMINIVKNASYSIGRKIEVEREIQMIINSKKYEQSVMNVVPLFIVLYVRFTSPSMLKIMYTSFLGRVVMSICLIIYIAAFLLGNKLSKVEI